MELTEEEKRNVDIINADLSDGISFCTDDCESHSPYTGNCDCGGWEKAQEVSEYIFKKLKEQRERFLVHLELAHALGMAEQNNIFTDESLDGIKKEWEKLKSNYQQSKK